MGRYRTMRTVDTEPTVEEQLLAQAKMQTESLESLRTIAVAWSVLAGIAAVIWLIAAIAAGS